MKIEQPGYYRTKLRHRAEVVAVRDNRAIGWVEDGRAPHPSAWKTEDGDVWNGRWGDELVARWHEPVSRTMEIYLADRPGDNLVILEAGRPYPSLERVIAHRTVTIKEGDGMGPRE